MSRVGVHVTTTAQAGRAGTGVASGRFFLAGLAERGPANTPTIVRSAAAFATTFGGRTAYNSPLYDTIRSFFEEGGGEAVFVRAVGPAATTGNAVLKDNADADTVTLTASSAGAWSAGVSIVVTQVGATAFAPARSRLTVTGPAGVESFTEATVLELVESINRRSKYLVATPVPGDNGLPSATIDPVVLTAGDDDRAAAGGAVIADALGQIGTEYGTGAVALPGLTADTVGDVLLNHAQQFNRVALMAMDVDTPVSEVEGAAAELGQHPAADYGAILYPWVTVPDGSASRQCPPEGYAAAKRSEAHATYGPWRTPAGDFSTADWLLGTVDNVSQSLNEELVDQNVTGIMTGNGKTRLYGWWSLSENSEHFEMLTARDTLNYLTVSCQQALEEFVFDTIDGRGLLTGKIESALVGVLDPIARGNGFYPSFDAEGNELDPGYQVTVDDSLNTPATLAENKIMARVAVRLSPTANLIELEIVKVPFTAAL
ncbi:hypothetical protein [Brevibacterium moorei]|uniref:hypothetical protein n=1 Tax=Brevibacterium moorei TaxID=2968457 RepID=UPI00211C77C6|nr:hypothetical protein [Brevibacterium sp. 68QC2CO]MCQ9384449.1 hypothetical protein [Brevibacterium sp. 68QC2CO]